MVSEQKIEEILEAIWVADEADDHSLDCIRENCPVNISEEDLEALALEGLVERAGEQVKLTDPGRDKARSIIRCHRLTECLLVNVLQMPMEGAHDIACHMEHLLPEEMSRGICTLLGHPEITPDNRPIPPGDDCLDNQQSTGAVIVNLTKLEPGDEGRIAYIKPRTHQRSHQLAAFGLVPGITVELHQRYPAFCIMFEGTELALDEDVARDIFVARK